MLLRKLLEPSDRDFELYHAHVSDGITQADLAKQEKISAPRVSQIIAKTRKWIANHLPGGRESESPEQDSVVALATRLYEVKRNEKAAREWHLAQGTPPKNAPKNAPKDAKPQPGDPRWLKLADDLSARKDVVEQRLLAARHAAAAKLETDGAYQEDRLVEAAIGDAHEMHEAIQEAQRERLCAPCDVPQVNERAIEIAVRNALRQANPGRRLSNHNSLPPEWQKVAVRMFDEALGGLCAKGASEAKSVENGPKTAVLAGDSGAYDDGLEPHPASGEPGTTADLSSSAPAELRDEPSVGEDHDGSADLGQESLSDNALDPDAVVETEATPAEAPAPTLTEEEIAAAKATADRIRRMNAVRPPPQEGTLQYFYQEELKRKAEDKIRRAKEAEARRAQMRRVASGKSIIWYPMHPK